MGARWPWHAVCVSGHVITGYSGGSNGVCEAGINPITGDVLADEEWDVLEDEHRVPTICGQPISQEYQCWNTCPLDKEYVAPATHTCPTCGAEHSIG